MSHGAVLRGNAIRPAMVIAVVDAPAHAGAGDAVEAVQMPLTTQAVWRALRGRYAQGPLLPG